jgi:hypothetical protein
MLPFKQLTYDDIPTIEKYISYQDYRTSEYTIAGIYMWRRYFDMAWCVVNDMLFIRMTFQSETPYFCVPVGPGDLRSALGELRNCCREQRQDLYLATVPDGARSLIEEEFGNPMSVESTRDWYDYLYLTEELANLTGKKFKTQRNHINKFKRSYTDYRFVRINAENIDQVRDFYKEYAPDNTPKGELPESESQAVSEFINEYYDRFNSIGYFLEIHGEVAGFAFGEIVNDTLFVHIEKASLNWHGSYQMLVNGFALELPSEIKYINREEDVGIEGLRQSKLSYNPVELLAKHTIRVKL